MNSKERVTLEAVNTDVGWIKTTLIRLEEKIDDRDEKTEKKIEKHEEDIKANTAWRWKTAGISIGISIGGSAVISIVTLILIFTR